jgi:retinol dehydrogenase 12
VGLGREAARHFAGMNPQKLILACRNQVKGSEAVEDIVKSTGVSAGTVETWELDLANFDSVKAFAARGKILKACWLMIVEKELGRLDILVENAGIAIDKFHSSKDGWEETYPPPPTLN